jgi:octaheme c-type cytochrome (tetrathionate reductase family)
MKTPATLLIVLWSGISVWAQEDHSQFIEGPFSTPQEVTETCLLCHDGIDKNIMKTRHWNWLGDEFTNDKGVTMRLGKQNLINNFCISLPGNWPRCTSCHIGYGWEDESFDFSDPNNIDCLVCHDHTGTYKKVPTGAGMPDPSVDLVKVAQSVGKTTIRSCSVCHFNGGGGPGVKHGDLTASMSNPSPALDFHMGELGFSCSDCHAGENHMILGASHGSMATGTNHMGCLDCHTDKPHRKKVVNDHVRSVACETCHIPTFARVEPTKTWWDWSTAGQDISKDPDEFGMPVYDKKKGDFLWEKNVVPEYKWYNGKADYHLMGDKIDPGNVVEINSPSGTIYDETAKITPFKLMRGKQIYDTKNRYLITPKMFGEGGYWTDFDWNRAAELGMAASHLEYSGQYGFVETRMYWPVNHMVAPADQALKCTACHTRKENKRLDWIQLGYKGDPMTIGGRAK